MEPRIFCAISPTHLFRFVRNANIHSWRSLGSIILCVAGSEAMFADLGHFSKKSIKITFICLIYPALILCYVGQASFISKNLHIEDFNHLSVSVPGHPLHVFIVFACFSCRKPRNNNSQFLYYTPVPPTWLLF